MSRRHPRTTVTALLTAAGLLAAAVGSPPASADPDPAPPPGAPVPTPDQVSALLGRLTDPTVPDAVKSTLVDGGLSPEQLGLLDKKVDELNAHGELPFTYVVTDIVPAINNLSGVTMSLTGPHAPRPIVKPLVLVKNGDDWKLTNDSYDPTFIHVVKWIAWYNDEGGRWEGGGGNVAIFGW